MNVLAYFLRCIRFSPITTAFVVLFDNIVLAASFGLAWQLPKVIEELRAGRLVGETLYLVVGLIAVSVGGLVGRVLAVSYMPAYTEKALTRNMQSRLGDVPPKATGELRRVVGHLARAASAAAGFFSSILTGVAAIVYLFAFVDDQAAIAAIVIALVCNCVAFLPVIRLSTQAARGMREHRKLLPSSDEEETGIPSSFDSYYRSYFMRLLTAHSGGIAYYFFLAFAMTAYLAIIYSQGRVLAVGGLLPTAIVAAIIARLESQAISNFVKGAALTESADSFASAGDTEKAQLASLWYR